MVQRVSDLLTPHKAGALLEAFVLANFAFLVADVFLAHSANGFRHPAEWIPFWFSVFATILLSAAFPRVVRGDPGSFAHMVGLAVGGASIALGIAGLIFHLEGQFFAQRTLRSLVYTAPFIAPLAYSGIGFLLLLNRLVPQQTAEWRWWVIFLAMGGFLGCFVLAVCDHEQNGFFYLSEWWPVVSSAIAVGVLAMILVDRQRSHRGIALGTLGLQAVTGLAGFYFHLAADISGLSASLLENFIHGAPVFAPLLFVDLAVLTAIGILVPTGSGSAAACSR